ncbi:MAG: hypothetical protein RLN60_05250 [Phycisphaerales bacterium]
MVSLGPRHLDFSSNDLDLRRARRRDVAECLVERARWVRPDERRLVERVYRDGASIKDVSEALGVRASVAGNRLRRAARRMLSARFEFVLAQRASWTGRRRSVARLCVLEGRPMREACETLGLTLHMVRNELKIIDALVRESKGGTR